MEDPQSLNSSTMADSLAEFERNLAKRDNWSSAFHAIVYVYLAGLFLMVVDILTSHGGARDHALLNGWIYAALCITGVAVLVSRWLKKEPSEFFNSLSDKRAIGFLIDVISLRNAQFGYGTGMRGQAGEALIRLLRQPHPSNDEAITAEQRLALARIAMREENGVLENAIIEVLAEIGLGESVRPLETMSFWLKSAEARDAAHLALARVRERVEPAKVQSVLLRPAADAPLQASLVRPANSPNTADPSTLLQVPSGHESHQGVRLDHSGISVLG